MATINGTAGNDTLSGTTGDDTINGLGGNDLFVAGGSSGGGADLIDGGTGTDSIEFRERATSGIVVDFSAGTITGGGTGTISFTNVERVVAGNFNDSLTGNAAAQTLTAQGGADTLWGAGGIDTLWGGSGADTFIFREMGTANADRISDWASGSDTLVLDGSVMSALGASGDFAAGDVRFWSSASGVAHDADDRIIFNTTTRQVFYDADGNGSGAAQLIATLQSGATLVAADIAVEGGSSGQLINGTPSNDALVGGPGDDTINGFGGGDTLDGAAGNDSLDGGSSPDVLRGGEGNDTLLGGDGGQFHGTDWLFGGAGDDWLDGGADSDHLFGEDGNDILIGGSDARGAFDTLDGGAGADTMYGSSQAHTNFFVTLGDVVIDGGGFDEVHSEISWTLATGIENLRLEGTSAINGWGNSSDNRIFGNDAANYIFLGTGDDSAIGGGGDDTIEAAAGDSSEEGDFFGGGDGIDTLNLAGYLQSGVTVDLGGGVMTGGGSGGGGRASLSDIEIVVADSHDDRLTGSSAANLLDGGGGNDTLKGAGGIDTLIGGAGADTFILRETGTANADLLQDWASGSDRLVLDSAVMTALGAAGNFAAGDARFVANSTGTAQDANDRVVYNTTTRQVFYDADGNGSGVAELIATLQSGATLVSTDIAVDHNAGSDTIVGTEGNDTLTGTPSNEVIEGRGGHDIIDGGGGDDVIDGGTGNDSIMGTGQVLGGDGDDWLEIPIFYRGQTTLDGGAGNDTLVGFNELHGGDGNDFLRPDHEAAVLVNGGAGDDRIADFTFDDTVDGGAGSDTVMVIDHRALVIDLEAGTMTDKSGAMSVNFVGIEGVDRRQQELNGQDDHTYWFDDYISGNSANNHLRSEGGADTLTGGAGNDTLTGSGFGLDEDVYTFDAAPGVANADVISEFFFDSGESHIQLDLAAHAALGTRGNFLAGDARFFAGSGASSGQDSTDRIIYDTASGNLYYDADGSGTGAAQLIVTLQGAPTLVATDIAVIAAGAPAGTAGDDWMVGVDGYVNDVFNGGAGNDRFDGREGHDTIEGGIGNDTLQGGDGADLVLGGDGNDTLQKNSELEEIWFEDGGVGTDTLNGGLGDDRYELVSLDFLTPDPQDYIFNVVLQDAGGVDTVVTNDSWTLGEGFENLTLRQFFDDQSFFSPVGVGNALNNILVSENGNFATLDGAAGNDTLIGNADFNALTGGAGADRFIIEALPNTRSTHITDFASGADEIRLDATLMPELGASGDFSAGDARFHAGSAAHDADDRVIWDGAALWYDPDGTGSQAMRQLATFQSGTVVVASDIAVENGTAGGGQAINGTAANDTLSGTAGNDTINGLGGNDLFVVGANGGNDVIDGGTGTDSIEFRDRATSAVVVDFASGTAQGGGSGTITFTAIERVVASNFNDTLTGTAGTQTLTGQAGADTLAGAAGVDTLWGGGGADTFIFRETGTANADRISDWASGSDKVALDNAVMSALGTDGNFSAGDARFAAGAGFISGQDATDRVIFNTSTGSLYYDADGSGAGAAQLIATLQSGAAVAATDITVI